MVLEQKKRVCHKSDNDYGTLAFMINNLLAPARGPADLKSAAKEYGF